MMGSSESSPTDLEDPKPPETTKEPSGVKMKPADLTAEIGDDDDDNDDNGDDMCDGRIRDTVPEQETARQQITMPPERNQLGSNTSERGGVLKGAKNFFKKTFSFGDVDSTPSDHSGGDRDADADDHDDEDNDSEKASSTQPKSSNHRRVVSDVPNSTVMSNQNFGTRHATPVASSSVTTAKYSTSSTNNTMNKKKLNRGLSFERPTRPGLHGGGNIRWFHNLFPLRQVFVPRVPFPLWDDNWDNNRTNRMKLGERPARVVVRHVLLIRHGQYDDSQKNDDAQNVLTDLGKRQAKTTGERLAHIILQASGSNSDGSCPLKSLSCSSLTRAKQTADIIYEEIQTMISKYNEEKPDQPWDPVERKEPDPLLIEGFPIHHIPGPTGFTGLKVNEIDRDFPRVESAFKKYIATSDWLDRRDWSTAQPQISSKKSPKIDHEYEIVVAHANVIRFFFCRAIQISPECWLRFNLYHCSITYLVVNPNGHVNCRSLGDIGHITDHSEMTIDNKSGLNWV